MKRFYCSCGNEIFFDNSHCTVCDTTFGFDPDCQQVLALQQHPDEAWFSDTTIRRYKLCQLRPKIGCNWLIPAADDQQQCASCRSTRTIPSLTVPRNLIRWTKLEHTKRRALYMLLRLGLPLKLAELKPNTSQPLTDQHPDLKFDFLEDQRSNPNVALEFVYSGHGNGAITINAAEADDSFRTASRELMNETYRTLLGHFRHELGHYYSLLLESDRILHDAFCQLFGNGRQDYKAALDRYYHEGARVDWQDSYISAYASAHPQEDWAETWAHYLHICDTLETAIAYGVIAHDPENATMAQSLSKWGELTIMLNALNRSMGVDDAYPFVITPTIADKLCFIGRCVKAWRANCHNAARQ